MDTLAQLPKYNLNEEQEKKLILREYRALLRGLKTKLKPGRQSDLSVLPFEMAGRGHKTYAKKKWRTLILHPIAVARNLRRKRIGLGVRSTICSLLHDTG
jgi:GTP pyrophosphokinase